MVWCFVVNQLYLRYLNFKSFGRVGGKWTEIGAERQSDWIGEAVWLELTGTLVGGGCSLVGGGMQSGWS